MKTLVIGASSNPERYANMALKSLLKHQHEVVAIGLKKEVVEGVTIETEK
ncbi:MAG: CoA-binding protein, partial [Flavobacterium sp.]|nr:CoA-binding protein [Flavobacterium sp.]